MKKAIELLVQYNNWRRDDSNIFDMPDPKEIGRAIDVAIAVMRKNAKTEMEQSKKGRFDVILHYEFSEDQQCFHCNFGDVAPYTNGYHTICKYFPTEAVVKFHEFLEKKMKTGEEMTLSFVQKCMKDFASENEELFKTAIIT